MDKEQLGKDPQFIIDYIDTLIKYRQLCDSADAFDLRSFDYIKKIYPKSVKYEELEQYITMKEFRKFEELKNMGKL